MLLPGRCRCWSPALPCWPALLLPPLAAVEMVAPLSTPLAVVVVASVEIWLPWFSEPEVAVSTELALA